MTRSRRQVLLLVLFAAVLGVWWWAQAGGDEERRTPSESHSDHTQAPPTGTDPVSGLPWIPESDLPHEAHLMLKLIDEGGPFPYDRDGAIFENRERLLPAEPRGYYREYTVETPGSEDRGARRIVTGDQDEFYWTHDHYQSFERIDR